MLRSRCSKEELLALVRDAAREHVRDLEIRVAPAFVDEQTRDRLEEAFARGDFATWGYDSARAERAADPRNVLADAKSLICIAFPYATPLPRRERLQGRVSNYAWSRDYHQRLSRTLRAIARCIDEYAGDAVTAVACDTKPIAERAFAARAGLGWIGKHTNLISPRLGSYVFLGEIVTTLDLEPDEPLRKSCGTCSRCVDACPTGALRGDYTIDATRCIADLTQRTDSVPYEMRPLIGDWVWGCDLCQAVCPPTQIAGERGSIEDMPASARSAAPDLLWLLRLRAGDFRREIEPAAMGWRGAAVLRRNAAIALGNALDRATIPTLLEALEEDPHPMVRAHVAWALGRIGAPAAIDALRERLPREGEPSVREEIVRAMTSLSAASR